MRFEDYLKDCLKNDEFRKYWEEDELRDSFDSQRTIKSKKLEENNENLLTNEETCGIMYAKNISGEKTNGYFGDYQEENRERDEETGKPQKETCSD